MDARLIRENSEDECAGEHAEHVARVEDAEEVVVLAREPHHIRQGRAHDRPVEEQRGVVAAESIHVAKVWSKVLWSRKGYVA